MKYLPDIVVDWVVAISTKLLGDMKEGRAARLISTTGRLSDVPNVSKQWPLVRDDATHTLLLFLIIA